jgi:hypothetical protein
MLIDIMQDCGISFVVKIDEELRAVSLIQSAFICNGLIPAEVLGLE